MRPFRFLAHIAADLVDGRQLAEQARRAESIGYDVLVLPDHLLRQHAPIPVLATVAAVTDRVRVGTFVFNAGLRHPAVLAQELASLDVLSGGRVEIGLGAGWNQPEHDAIGLPFPPIGERVSRLAETITVLKGCFGDGPFSFAGKHFQIVDYDGQPKPVQRPHPPLFVGGGGKRLLTLAAAQADIIGLAPRLTTTAAGVRADPRSVTLAATAEKIAWIRQSAGSRFDQLELNTYPSGGPVAITNEPLVVARERAERLTRDTGIEISAEELLASPHSFIGSIDDLVHKFVALREQFGISSFMVGDIDTLAPVVERLAGS